MRIGFRQGRASDHSRPNWDGSGPRPLAWTAWYPAPDDAVEKALFDDDNERSFHFGPVARDAPLHAGKSYPVVLLSHGTGGAAIGLDWLGHRLAARGFVAIGVDHHGNTYSEAYHPAGFLCLWERARDLTALLDRLSTDGPLAGRLDMGRVHAAGFSAGAFTVLCLCGAVTEWSRFERARPGEVFGPREFPDLSTRFAELMRENAAFRDSWKRMSDSYRDRRVRAVVACAPAQSVLGYREESVRRIDVPALIVVGEHDDVGRARYCAGWLKERMPTSRAEVLPKAGHYAFLPPATERGRRVLPDICIDPPGVDRVDVHDRVAALAARLFSLP